MSNSVKFIVVADQSERKFHVASRRIGSHAYIKIATTGSEGWAEKLAEALTFYDTHHPRQPVAITEQGDKYEHPIMALATGKHAKA